MSYDSAVVRYFEDQAGSGLGNFYRGASYQKGHGLGSFLAGLFRSALPFLRSGASAIGKEALRAGSSVLSDVAAGNTNLKQAFKRRAEEAGMNLSKKLDEKVRKMTGNGAKRVRTRQSAANSRKKRSQKGKSAKRKVTRRKTPKKKTARKVKRKTSKKPIKKRTVIRDIFA